MTKIRSAHFPQVRLRRLRSTSALRELLSETRLHPSNLVAPFFVTEMSVTHRLAAFANHPQYSLNDLLRTLEGFLKQGGRSAILFGIPKRKDPQAAGAYSPKGVIQNACRAIKKSFRNDLVVITDLCFCEYTDHGHCGILKKADKANEADKAYKANEGDKAYKVDNVKKIFSPYTPSTPYSLSAKVDNDATLEIIAKTALSQAEAGADIIAPSGMMDGQIKTIREALDKKAFVNTPILSYAAKFASGLYGPFRDLAGSAPGFGNRKSYQMNPANSREALREIALDVQEGADIVMVKPASFYLDVLSKARERFDLPLAAFQVSGEAWMIEEYARQGFAKRQDIILESLISIKRAGADLIISYFAEELLQTF